jgi:hypothetical protein
MFVLLLGSGFGTSSVALRRFETMMKLLSGVWLYISRVRSAQITQEHTFTISAAAGAGTAVSGGGVFPNVLTSSTSVKLRPPLGRYVTL